MPTQTFPCPFCNKKMGVGYELLGKKVRCPHCNQILVAPLPNPAPVAAPSPPIVQPIPQPGYQLPQQPVVQPVPQPGYQLPQQSVVQPIPQPGYQLPQQPVVQPIPQPGYQLPQQPVVQPIPQPGYQLPQQPVVQPIPQPGYQLPQQPVVQPVPQPEYQLPQQPVVQPVPQPEYQLPQQPVVQPIPQPAAESPPQQQPAFQPPQEAAPELPVFNIPSQEARESIFGDHEEESDDVFGSSDAKKPLIPDFAPPEPAAPPSAPAPSPEAPPLFIPPGGMPELAYSQTVEMQSPAELAAPPLPAAPAPTPLAPPTPFVVPYPSVAPIGATPVPSSGENPWAGMDEAPSAPAPTPYSAPAPAAYSAPATAPAPYPAPVPYSTPEPESPFANPQAPHGHPAQHVQQFQESEAEPHEAPTRSTRGRRATATPPGKPIFKIACFILIPYALVMTGLAVYGMFMKSDTPAGHPLSALPDTFGEFAPAERKKSSKLRYRVDGEIPPEQRVALKGKLDIGQLEIEPTRVEQRPLEIVTQGKGKEQRAEITPVSALVLHMKIRNTSDDLLIHPLDPAFNRRVSGSDRVGTGLTIGKQTVWGGAIAWPFSSRVKRVYEKAQKSDEEPLKPGETREYVVFTNARQQVLRSVRDASGEMLWRVQVRRGRINYHDRDIPVTAIIGVEFKPGDVESQ